MVAIRAGRICEYCLIAEADTLLGCQVEHIVSVKHGGATVADNLALACADCNVHKGSDVGSFVPGTDRLVRFFNPCRERWAAHFRLNETYLEPLTDIGEATSRIFRFNDEERRLERQVLLAIGRYPNEAAGRKME